jgi:L-threonylcarbamoyladenylate synthase
MSSIDIQPLVDRLMAGEPVVFPTDTLPALACRPQDAASIWALKQRPMGKPLILMGASADELIAALQQEPPQGWRAMAQLGWPGALTLVLPAQGPVAQALNPAAGNSLGLRVPAARPARELLAWTGPLATTSVNRSGEAACTTAAEVAAEFPELMRLGPEPWPPGSGQASTVVAWQNQRWKLLRQGAVSVALADG